MLSQREIAAEWLWSSVLRAFSLGDVEVARECEEALTEVEAMTDDEFLVRCPKVVMA